MHKLSMRLCGSEAGSERRRPDFALEIAFEGIADSAVMSKFIDPQPVPGPDMPLQITGLSGVGFQCALRIFGGLEMAP